MQQQRYDVPSQVFVEDGMVIVDGPGGVAISLTPEAARLTGERLITAAEEADRDDR